MDFIASNFKPNSLKKVCVTLLFLVSSQGFAENQTDHHKMGHSASQNEKIPDDYDSVTKSDPQKEQTYRLGTSSDSCNEMETWDVITGMCAPLPMEHMRMTHFMLHGNAFLTHSHQFGPRGEMKFAVPNMVMADLGRTPSDKHFLNLNVMLTAEKWTFPEKGYPQLLQIGERDHEGNPYIDAQHPHSSPIMGITLSDTFRFDASSKDFLKVFFAPRGQATDGPIAFMHRPTGMVNPDAPLGHHLGQDVSHITSTVIGASLKLGKNQFEASTFNGTEPEPTEVDLPLGVPNSYAVRYIREFTPKIYSFTSVGFIQDPEPHGPSAEYRLRYSASLYTQYELSGGWNWYNSFILGAITHYDTTPPLYSFTEEFWFRKNRSYIWGRAELLQRTAEQLQLSATHLKQGEWVAAGTLGYTHAVFRTKDTELGLGASATKYLLPGEFAGAYGGNPWAMKVFLQLSGMKMFASH